MPLVRSSPFKTRAGLFRPFLFAISPGRIFCAAQQKRVALATLLLLISVKLSRYGI
jgi:hypothetical protein